MTRVCLIGFDLGSGPSGQANFLVRLSAGLASRKLKVVVCADSIREPVATTLSDIGATHYAVGSEPVLRTVRLANPRARWARRLYELTNSERCDAYVILADEALPIVQYAPDRRFIYISQGDPNLLFLNDGASTIPHVLWNIASASLRYRIRFNAKLASHCKLLLANSKFTSNLMSFLYNLPFQGVVYPPVDHGVFRPTAERDGPSYALALVRNNDDPSAKVISAMAKEGKVEVVGRASIDNAVNLGEVSVTKLVELYSRARVLISATPRELFGLPVIESLACGTPVLTFSQGGPAEIVVNGFNGWTVDNGTQMAARLRSVLEARFDSDLRKRCIESSMAFSISKSADTLINLVPELHE
jgi:hypothetical protein